MTTPTVPDLAAVEGWPTCDWCDGCRFCGLHVPDCAEQGDEAACEQEEHA